MDEEKREEKIEEVKETSPKKSDITEKVRKNPWIIATFVCGTFVIVLIISTLFGGVTGNAISADAAGEKLLSFYESVGVEGLSLNSIKEISGLYQINFNYNEDIVTMYVTLDGENFIPESALTPIEGEVSSETETEIPKSEKPNMGLFIWSYCPYGVTALEPFAEVASLLENYADFKVYLYYAGHGDFEEKQNKIQACIQELGYTREYWEYSKTFVTEIYESYVDCYYDENCDVKEYDDTAQSVTLMTSLGINSDDVLECVESQGETLITADYNAAKEIGISGSPSLIINGVYVSASRTAEAYKDAVCSAFTDAPEECAQELSSTGTTTSGSCG